MSKKICRTCLKMTYKTYKTHENIHYPGEIEQLKISDMLRYLIPELYLGVTVSPEICEDCKLSLRSAYAFRKKCLATENLIGSYLKKSRCTAASIELIDVKVFLEHKRKTESQNVQNEKIQVKAQEIISEWDDDSQDAEQPNVITQKENLHQTQKELTLSPELGVFVDKFGNCYNADGISIAHPNTIVNAQTDFFKITEVYSLNEEDEPLSKNETTKSPEEQSDTSKKKLPIIRVIPEANSSFTKPRISIIAEAKTDLMEPCLPKLIQVKPNLIAPRISVIPEAKTVADEPTISTASELNRLLEVTNEPVEPVLPIIVDVRSECETVEPCSPHVTSDFHSENVEPSSSNLIISEIKEEPIEPEKQDDEETLTGSETNSNYESIQGILDNIPDDNYYVDIPEFVHINNFSLKDLDELRQKQKQSGDNKSLLETTLKILKPLPKLLPKPVIESNLSIANQIIIPEGSQQSRLLTIRGNDLQTMPNSFTQLEKISKNKVFIKKPATKKCVVPQCPNNSDLNPKKLFVLFPKKESRRTQWFEAVGVQSVLSPEVYICEDHFDLTNDMENWMQFKVFGGRMKMKEDVVPHKYLNETIPEEMIYKSQLNDVDRKRRAEQLERLEKVKAPRPNDSDESVISDVQSIKCTSSEVQVEPQPSEASVQPIWKQAVIDYCNYQNDEKPKPRIIRKGRRRIKIVPVDEDILEKQYKTIDDDICVLFTNYTKDGIYVNDHDYLVTPYKRNKILVNEDSQWLCMCFICGFKHPVKEHIAHMNRHLSVCFVCKADLGTPFMLNMHVRFHTKKCSHCTEKVLYRELAQHQKMHLEEEAEFEKGKVKRTHWRGKKIIDKDEKPVYFPIKIGNDLEGEESTQLSPGRRLRASCTKQTEDLKNETAISHNPVEPVQEILKSAQNSTENIEEIKEEIPERTDISTDSTPSSNEVENSNSVDDKMMTTPHPKEPTKRKRIKLRIKEETPSPDTNDQPKKKRKYRSRELDRLQVSEGNCYRDEKPLEMEESSPRVLRSRQKKDNKEEFEITVPENATPS